MTNPNPPSPSFTVHDDGRIDVLLGVAEIARVLGLSERQVRHLIRRGFLPAGRLGGKLVASRRLLEQAIAGALGGCSLPDGDN